MLVRLTLLAPLLFLAACSSASPALQSSPATSPEERVVDLQKFFGEIDGAFVLLDPKENRLTIHNPSRARRGFIPASTFKIPNTLIALETGVADGPDFELQWDSSIAPRREWWPASWAKDHTLRTALANSAVWYYQEIARRIGASRMQEYVDRFEYGNGDISGGIDMFWLTGELRISAVEQVRFLERFHAGQLGLSERTSAIARELLVIDQATAYRLSGKTGWASFGEPGSTRGVGWLVGYVERGDEVWFYATNIEITSNADAAARVPITKSILAHFGLIDA